MIREDLPQIVLGVVKNNNGKVLIVQRAKLETGTDNVKLSWAFPGGKVEENESLDEAVAREVLEETAIFVTPLKIISERKHPQFPVYVYYFECLANDKHASLKPQSGEIKQIKWVSPDNIIKYFTSDLDPNISSFLGIK